MTKEHIELDNFCKLMNIFCGGDRIIGPGWFIWIIPLAILKYLRGSTIIPFSKKEMEDRKSESLVVDGTAESSWGWSSYP